MGIRPKAFMYRTSFCRCSISSTFDIKLALFTVCVVASVHVQEVPRTPDHAPSRTFYLFSVNLLHVARMVLERAYKVTRAWDSPVVHIT